MVDVAPRVVIIGAGIVGCALADEVTARGWTDVTVLDQGPLFHTGGSTSHAPGLVFQTNGSKTMTEFASYTVRKLRALSVENVPCFQSVGGLEVAASQERWDDLHRKHGWAEAWGVATQLLSADECGARHSLLDPTQIYGGLFIPDDGLAKPVLAARAQAERARARGAKLIGHQRVTAIEQTGGHVRRVVTEEDSFPADLVVVCTGMWGPLLSALTDTDVSVPLMPMAHQYVRTSPLASLAHAEAEAVRPILRHQDQDLYFREHHDRLGIGAYGHRPMPVAVDAIGTPAADHPMPSVLPFTADDFDPWWRQSAALLPELSDAKIEEGINGLFSFTPDGMPLLGPSQAIDGLWVAEAVWITHAAGVGKAVAEWMVDGQPATDVHECDINRFERIQHAPAYVQQRGCQNFIEVYDVIHPMQPKQEPRPLRVSPFYTRQVELGAYFLEANGWERPQWFEDNARRLRGRTVPERGEWAGRYWSPIAGAEAQVTRERVALYDMTSLKRIEVSGPGALEFLQRISTNNLDKPPGRVTYTLLLNQDGGVRSDLTVARLAPDRFQVGVNSELDLDWMTRHLPADGTVQARDITPGTCCVGVWGPLARELVQPLTETDFSHEAFKFYHARQAYIEHVPVVALRLSYVGELGWELYTTADLGLQLWDTLWEAGQQFGVIAGGRGAFNSLRLEKGYRAWGTDVTTEHDPYEAGLGFAVRMDKGDFIGRSALVGKNAQNVRRKLTCLTMDEPTAVVCGKEPVYAGGEAVGYVTSAEYGYTIGASIAYAWLPATVAVPGTPVEVEYFGQRLSARVSEEPLFDPKMDRIRS